MGFLDIKNATKSYGSLQVLHETNIAVEEGEFLVLVGPSGCGKSTLLNMIAGLEEVTSGEIAIRGNRMNEVRPAERNIAMVFQSYALYPNMNVAQNIAFGLEMHGVPKPKREEAVRDVAELLQITKLLDRKPGQLSGGQRQRVAMGRALVRDPDVFLFDEPLSNLDAKLRVDMRTEIKKLHQKLGTTIVYVTHDQIEALTLSTRIAVMFGGYVQQLGTPKEIYDDPANMFVAGFMGSPSMNLFPAKIAVANGVPQAEFTLVDGKTGALPLPNPAMAEHDGRSVILGIRPEAITDLDGADRNSKAIHQVEARVEVTEPAGSDTFVVSEFGSKEITGRFRADVVVKPGDIFPFAINMDKAVLFDPETENRIR
ncbi:carbohydrate ABC transporter ATP-binding protein, CUT1 family (TC 3.A.1.1.-) [Roseibium hamelinense]|uniref:Carbohydrate ABC transporter ATP-binding protein, CUT1 family (TC 3.A.1.1.-) n=1 Tax=Roseibium hamelinense TaxID=150831 RepID=A0A562SYD5_9HYPH|nr:sn-glycerol-3-phosphate ABC transporter ATP-binding protein UgpC [Roseibium hamelinense]MTI44810.1 sn-glycerol-3-phosphate ABC transporter ATP-binding protein UgpC [Roseibium hamelinense]TWI85998.1 carbohydrate ABC transporter ATP-binding protein, CUT1 family (TC 3.A.1.1.-) [Roseibium hamelinense]